MRQEWDKLKTLEGELATPGSFNVIEYELKMNQYRGTLADYKRDSLTLMEWVTVKMPVMDNQVLETTLVLNKCEDASNRLKTVKDRM